MAKKPATKRPKIGDVFEIKTSVGFVYFQYTHKDKESGYGEVIRVFDRVFEERPRSLDGIEESTVRFTTFFTLSSAVRHEEVVWVAHRPIAAANREFPIFRYGIPHPQHRRVEKWYFWEPGDKYTPITDFSPSHRQLPIVGLWNFLMLKDRIEERWTPQSDTR